VGTALRFDYDECRRRNAVLLAQMQEKQQIKENEPEELQHSIDITEELEMLIQSLVDQACAAVE
jgi:hypothetical protein